MLRHSTLNDLNGRDIATLHKPGYLFAVLIGESKSVRRDAFFDTKMRIQGCHFDLFATLTLFTTMPHTQKAPNEAPIGTPPRPSL
ncbi:hypothetical protein KC221_23430, partial [Mycobacterium tuberculosis]|nr:hypothetical protein [Mycobacterium tuberculosis]